jgi:hypothetical protein
MVMRTQSIATLFGLLVAGHAQAQTWEQPSVLYPYDAISSNTCASPRTIAAFDGTYSPGPDVVYQFLTVRHPPHPYPGHGWGRGQPPHSELLTLIPQFPYPGSPPQVDFEIFVCSDKTGWNVFGCALEADDIDHPGQPVQITIPPEDLTFHVVITSGMLNGDNNFGNGCGPYTLFVQPQ